MIPLVPITKAAWVNPNTPKHLFADSGREVHFIPMADVSEEGSFRSNGTRKLGDVQKGYTYFENGDVLIAKITPCMENGKAAFIEGMPLTVGFGSTEFHVLRPKPGVSGRYLFYMIWNPWFRRVAERNMAGTAGQKRVPSNFFDWFKIPLPTDIDEQERIASILGKADSIRRKQRKARQLARQLVRSSFIDLFGDPLRNNKGWRTERLGQLAQLDRGRSRHRPRDEPRLYGDKYPFIQTGDIANANSRITSYRQMYSELGLEQSRLWPAGTLCITIAANIAHTAILTFPACFPDSVVGLVPGEELQIDYVQQWFVAVRELIDRQATQVAQKNINLEILNNLMIPVPPEPLQLAFGKIVKKVRECEDRLLSSSRTIEAFFESLIDRAFHGEL